MNHNYLLVLEDEWHHLKSHRDKELTIEEWSLLDSDIKKVVIKLIRKAQANYRLGRASGLFRGKEEESYIGEQALEHLIEHINSADKAIKDYWLEEDRKKKEKEK